MPEAAGPLRVLLVEGSPADAELVAAQLRRDGYELELELVEDGPGMAAALERPWDIVVCDYDVPGFDAYEALALARESGSDAPFVILSGAIGEEAVVDVLRAGARDCVLKANLPRLAFVIGRELAEVETRRRSGEVEAALARSEERYRRLTENAPDIVYSYRFAPEQCYEYLSPAVTAIIGYTPEELCGNAELIRAIVHPDDWVRFTHVPESAEPTTIVTRWFAKNGLLRLLELHDVPVLDEQGVVVGVEGIARDITLQQQVESDLRESEERLRLALDNARMIVWERDLESGEMTFGGSYERMFGLDRPPATIAELTALVHPDDRETLERGIEERLAGLPGEVEVRVVGPDGAERWVATRGTVIKDDSGRPTRMIGTAFDISERKAIEEDLRTTSETLEAIVRAAPVAISTTDRLGRATMWNPAAERMFGWPAEEVLGSEVPIVPAEEAESAHALMERVVSGDTVIDFQTTRAHRDGQVLEISLSVAPLRDATGEVSGIMAMHADVSEQALARRQLQGSFERLQEADAERRRLLERLTRAQEEERQRIASDIHDDSVQVLTAVVLRLELLGARIDDPELLGMVEEIGRTARTSIMRLRHLIFELRPPALDRDGLVAALRLYLEQLRQDRTIDCSLESRLAAEPGPETRVIVYRIVQEALVNVVKHAQARRVEVVLEERKGGVLARVTDDGVGLPEGAVESPDPGHLGLVAMRERAEIAGGWWRISSTAGEGTTVEFLVPDVGQSAGEETVV